MRTHLHSIRNQEVSAHSLLFARYLAGQIPDAAWQQIMNILDAEGTSMEERVALASFLSDACGEVGPESVKVPRLEEVEDFVTLTRAA